MNRYIKCKIRSQKKSLSDFDCRESYLGQNRSDAQSALQFKLKPWGIST